LALIWRAWEEEGRFGQERLRLIGSLHLGRGPKVPLVGKV